MKRGLLCFFIACCFTAGATISLPAIISSNMVLQQKSSVKLWGWANANEKVVVTTSWNGKVDSAKGDENASWQVSVQTPSAGGPYTITIKGSNTILLQNILIGEVWICSGQSNMEMNYNWGLPQMKDDFASAANSNIRFFTVPHRTAKTPQDDTRGEWATCDSITVKSFSAVAYYFGRKLNANLNIPIGLIHASWGGTPAEVWTPAEAVAANPLLKEAAQKLHRANGWPITPGFTYNAMIAPFTNYSIAGSIWYQGESNTGTATTYQTLFTTMIEAWRKAFDKDFPFYYVQLAPYKYGNKNIGALVREAQLKTLALPKTGMVVTNDIAEDTMNIHPKNKRDVGYRLAGLALANTYQQNLAGTMSPLYKSMRVEKEKITLLFDNAGGGLMLKGKRMDGFWVAGMDKIFYPAEAKISGDNVLVWSKNVPRPVAVRYAFSNTAVGNVFSKEGLPLSPFRTDDWEVDTSSEK